MRKCCRKYLKCSISLAGSPATAVAGERPSPTSCVSPLLLGAGEGGADWWLRNGPRSLSRPPPYITGCLEDQGCCADTVLTRTLQPKGSRSDTSFSYRVPGHRQKLEDQTKPFADRYGELERLRQSMRVTPTTPSPRGTLSTPSHFGSQAQTPIQGTSRAPPWRRAAGTAAGLRGRARGGWDRDLTTRSFLAPTE